MSDTILTMREYEAGYYAGMPSDVKILAEERNTGIRLVQFGADSSDREKGLDLLEKSADDLQAVEHPYSREYFASLYMLSRGLLLRGEYEQAASTARIAMDNVPEVAEEFREFVVADQYTAIASSRLSVVLQAMDISIFGEWEYALPYREGATTTARLARQTCRFSEDRARMLFADGGMGDEKRLQARRRHEIAAVAATAGLWLPGLENRRRLARKLCA